MATALPKSKQSLAGPAPQFTQPRPSAVAAHQLLDQPVGVLVKQFAPQYLDRIPPDKAKQTFREVLKTADFMTKGFVMSIVGQHLPKGVTAEDITNAVNEAPPAAAPAEAPAAPAEAPAAPAPGSAAAVPAFAPAREPIAAGASEHYRKMREPFAAELKDPATRRLLMGIISAENFGAGSAVAESLMNRTAMVNEARAAKGQPPLTLKAMIQGDASLGGKSFYGPVRTGAINEHLARVDADKNYAAKLDSYITSALGGANTISGHTDQGSKGDPNYDAGGVGININGERFNDWGYAGSKAWRERNQSLMSNRIGGGSTPDYPDPTPDVGAGQSYYDEKSRYEAENPVSTSSTTAPGSSPVATDAAKPKNYGEGVGEAFEGLGKMFAGSAAQNALRGSTPANLPGSGTMTAPAGVQPMVDPRLVEMQRQQLALALQRLNSGKLF